MFTYDAAKEWVEKRAKRFLDVDLRKYAVTDCVRFEGAIGPDRARVLANYAAWDAGTKKEAAECAGFASLVFNYMKNPSVPNDSSAPRVERVGLTGKAGAAGLAHNFVLVNRRPTDDSARAVTLDPASAEFAESLIVDGWYSGMGHVYEDTLYRPDPDLVSAWGSRLEIHESWNPVLQIDFRMGLKKRAVS